MEQKELLSKVRKIEIKTKRLSNHLFAGEYHTAFKGKGMSFSEVRDYHYGDDIRNIDWNVTARLQHPFVKTYEEERELTVMLLVDVSPSSFLGSSVRSKSDLITEICAVLAFSAISNNDKTGLIMFGERIVKFIPPAKGKSHILCIIRELLNLESMHGATDLSCAIQYLNNVVKRRCVAFILSDFIAMNYEKPLQMASKKHEIIGIKIEDKLDSQLPDIGIIQIKDSETEETKWIDTSDPHIRKRYAENFRNRTAKFKDSFVQAGSGTIQIKTEEDYVKPLINFFHNKH